MMSSMILRWGRERQRTAMLFTQVSTSLLARMIGPLSAFLLALILAKQIGSESMGRLFVALTLLHVFGLTARLGMDTALLRFIATSSALQRAKGYYLTAARMSLAASILMGLVIALSGEIIAEYVLKDPDAIKLIYVIALAIPAFSLLGINASVMKAMARPVHGGFYEVSLWPLVTLVFVTAAMLVTTLTEDIVIMLYLCGIVVSIIASWKFSGTLLPRSVKPDKMHRGALLTTSLPLAGVELLNFALLGAPLLMLPALADINQAGLYSIAQRLAAQIALLMTVFGAIVAPRFASLYAQNNLPELVQIAVRSTRMLFMLSLLPSLILGFWAEEILTIFGSDFLYAKTALQILLVGFCLKHALGPVGYILAMTGYERDLHRISCLSLLVLLLCAIVLIPLWGAIGAALSTVCAMLVQASAASVMVARRLDMPLFLLVAREGEYS